MDHLGLVDWLTLRLWTAGSGKTRIAVEVAAHLLRRKPRAKVVFLATTVALAQQQAGTLLCFVILCVRMCICVWFSRGAAQLGFLISACWSTNCHLLPKAVASLPQCWL